MVTKSFLLPIYNDQKLFIANHATIGKKFDYLIDNGLILTIDLVMKFVVVW
jgi:hypothetical protein